MAHYRFEGLSVEALGALVSELLAASGEHPVFGRTKGEIWFGRSERRPIFVLPGQHAADVWSRVERQTPLLRVSLDDLPPEDGVEHWGERELGQRLDEHPSVADRFAAWVSDGDLLTLAPESLRMPFLRTLEAEVTSDHYARIDGGRDRDRRIPLARVFTELPASSGQGGFGVTEALLSLGDTPAQHREGHRRPARPKGVVLLGGPGQGKTTVGQYLCQLYRALWLEPHAPTLSPEAEAAVHALLRAGRGGGPRLPSVRRFPVRVPLARFAASLARGEVSSVMGWIARQLARHGSPSHNAGIDEAALARWLSSWPLLFVADGFDEVPASANRSQTVSALRTFLSMLADADLVTIITTRPQGYHGELSSEDYPEYHLLPLQPEHAKPFASALIRERHRSDTERQEELSERFDAACEDPEAVSLTRSPLQVTLLATLLERSGRPPRGRWRLFREYYRVIWDRECERGTEHASILQDHRTLVDRLHAEAGYLLHTAAETAGETDASLDAERFRELVTSLVAENGYRGEQAEHLVRQILEASLERLVFLVPSGDSGVGFEIRSLQEMFAAERIADGTDAQIVARLDRIAPRAHWRSVMRFVAGKILVERRHLAEALVALCEGLAQSQDDLLRRSSAGARLAIDLLEPLKERPDLVERLLDLALSLFEALPSLPHDRLVDEVVALGQEERLRAAVAPPRTPAAYHALERLAEAGADWAREAIEGLEDPEGRFLAMGWPYEPGFRISQRFSLPWGWGTFVRVSQPKSHIRLLQPKWRAFDVSLQRFSQAPSPESLVELLEAWPAEVSWRAWPFPWPVAASLQWLRVGGALSTLRTALLAQELGGGEDWRAADARWQRQGVTEEDLCAEPSSWPWRADISIIGPPPTSFIMDLSKDFTPDFTRILDPRWREWIAVEKPPPLGDPVWSELSQKPLMGEALLLRVAVEDWSEQGMVALDDYGRRYRYDGSFTVTSLPAFTAYPDKLGLCALAADFVRNGESVEIPHEWLQPGAFSDPRLAADALVLRVACSDPSTDLAALAGDIATLLPSVPTLEADLSLVIDRAPTPLLFALEALATRERALSEAIQRSLVERADATLSGLHVPDVALGLGLPVWRSDREAVLPEYMGPVHLTRLLIEGFRGVRTLALDLPPESIRDPEQGQWLFLLGENGAGKTTLLRALALALAPEVQASALIALCPGPARHLHADGPARIELTLRAAGDFSAEIEPSGAVRSRPQATVPFVVAYGSRRSSALGGVTRAVDLEPLSALASLFDERADVLHAETWLVQWAYRARSGEMPEVFESIRALVADLLPGVDTIDVTPDGVTARGAWVGEVPLASLSDGYLGTMGWVLDLVGRWLERERRAGRAIAADFPAKMTGLVLLDEIDLHLHPSWQWDIVERLKRHFPRLSFVATTHNPVTLLGAGAGEILVVRRREGEVSVRAIDLPPGVNADRILTGPWFGLPYTMSRETFQMLEQHRKLLREAPQDPRVATLESELRRRLVDFPGDTVEQMARAVAAEITDGELIRLDPEARERARAKLAEEVRRRRRSGP